MIVRRSKFLFWIRFNNFDTF